LTFQFADINGTKIHYDVRGTGEPLVLIHAGIAHLGMWDDQMAAFAQHHRVIRYDVRGWGKSKDPPGTYSQHDDLRALLQHLDVERAAVLGISNGGHIAIDFALAYPEMVKALIAVAPALSGYEPSFDEATAQKETAAEEAYERGDKAHAAELEAQIWVDGPQRTPEQVDADFRRRALEMIRYIFELPDTDGEVEELEPPAAGRLEEIQTPTLVIIGEQDVPAMSSIVDLLETNVAAANKVVMPGVAHFPNMEKPETFNQIVLDFLASIE
jgi:3-oxoadipate enol-lactonase